MFMEIKDYYKILELEPSASLQDIKKAYRRLAQQFHPDKNQNDQYALIHFTEIKEAFEVLTNPSRKNNYLQQEFIKLIDKAEKIYSIKKKKKKGNFF